MRSRPRPDGTDTRAAPGLAPLEVTDAFVARLLGLAVEDVLPPAATAADDQPAEQGDALARVASGGRGATILPQDIGVAQVLLPRDVGGQMIMQCHRPFAHREMPHARLAVAATTFRVDRRTA